MNSINHNNELSNFSNYLKKDPLNSLNFNDYQYDNPNSPSLSFPYFNNFSQNSNPLEKLEPQIKLQEPLDGKENTIGFNHLQGILQNSLQYPFDDFKNAKIKKPSTFQLTQGYLNALSEPIELCKDEHQKNVQQKKIVKGKGKQKQKIRNSGDINQEKQQKQRILKLEDLVIDTTPKSTEHIAKAPLHEEVPLCSESCLQNLKSIAKIAFEEIKRHKSSTYQSISQNLLAQLLRQSAASEESNSNKHEKCSVSSQGKSSKKSQIIQNMIKTKSFAQIKQMNQIQQQFDDCKTKKKWPKYENEDNNDEEDEHKQPGRNVKNIRRRLYDAINVMLAANVIQKRQRGHLSVKLMDTKKGKKTMVRSKEENQTYEQLQKKVQQKQKSIQAKRKYRQYLTTRQLLLAKHITNNKSLNEKNTKKEKLWFPLVFVNIQPPAKLNIETNAKSVEIQDILQLDLNGELDVLSFLYWIEKEQLIKKEEEFNTKADKEQRAKMQDDDYVVEKKKGYKKVKIEQSEL